MLLEFTCGMLNVLSAGDRSTSFHGGGRRPLAESVVLSTGFQPLSGFGPDAENGGLQNRDFGGRPGSGCAHWSTSRETFMAL